MMNPDTRQRISAAIAELDALRTRTWHDLAAPRDGGRVVGPDPLTADVEDLTTFADGLLAEWESLLVARDNATSSP
jgi:ABC-type Fe3+ transport system substrate-binding protein